MVPSAGLTASSVSPAPSLRTTAMPWHSASGVTSAQTLTASARRLRRRRGSVLVGKDLVGLWHDALGRGRLRRLLQGL